MLPCIVFEDEHLLVVNKPAGLNTHAPAPHAGQGLHEWLRDRELRWASLAIIHRLDKETSGIILFGKTTAANRSLTEQFTHRQVQKRYFLLTDRRGPERELRARSRIVRLGDRYLSRPVASRNGGDAAGTTEGAETLFLPTPDGTPLVGMPTADKARYRLVEARPLTGRTHQIRVHAADHGFPILGDTLYGGTAASRLFLHAAEIRLRHPVSGEELQFTALAPFATDARLDLRRLLVDPEETDALRLVHGAADGWPGWYVDKLGPFLLSQSEQPLNEPQTEKLANLLREKFTTGSAAPGAAYHKRLNRQVRQTRVEEASSRLALGEPAPTRFEVRENGLRFELSFEEGYSVGLFLDQRENRRRLLTGYVAPGFELGLARPGIEVLNTFAYTCGFSVCAARAGATVTSVDLSKKYLEWGKRNFQLNGLAHEKHQFLFGDVLDWLRRLGKKQRQFDLVLLDPPTFSQSRESGVFRAEKDYGKLVAATLPLIKAGGVLFASTNAAQLSPEHFLRMVQEAIQKARRKTKQSHYVPQPPDFPISREEPAYLKTVWVRL